MKFDRWREEDGLIRGPLRLLVTLAILAVIVLDSFAVISANQKVRSDATTAASTARSTYVQSGSVPAAQQAADNLLSGAGDRALSVSVDSSSGEPVFTVSATRLAKTYVLKYGVHLPWVGKQIDRWLHPRGTGTSQ
ncbi:MAG: hypothetical protein ACLQUT_13235 [Thermoleophilia bacterium]|jgi:hypothetical protein